MKRIRKVIVQIFSKYGKDGCSIYAGNLTYVTLLALVPFFIVFFKVIAVFKLFNADINKIQSIIFNNFIASSASIIQQNLLTFIRHGANLSTFSVIALLVTIVLMVFNIISIIDKIWQVEEKKKSIVLILRYVIIILLIPLSVALFIVISDFIFSLSWLSKASTTLPYVLIFLCFTLLNYFAPNRKVSFWSSCISGLITLIMFEVVRFLFVYYIQHFSNYNLLYGLFSVIPIFLVWVYLLWSIILLGVEINFAFSKFFLKYPSHLHE